MFSVPPPVPPDHTSPHIASIEEAIEEIRAGRMIILMDDEDRENEGDLYMAAEAVTPEAINFMAKYAHSSSIDIIINTIKLIRARTIDPPRIIPSCTTYTPII